jgi:hypothetical protein
MRFLTDDRKQQHVSVCDQLRRITSGKATFLSKMIDGDENWIYGYDP